jgi:hypothetical protein
MMLEKEEGWGWGWGWMRNKYPKHGHNIKKKKIKHEGTLPQHSM